MARRNNAVPRFSLFSFQDIITCITGILLLLTLMLILDLAKRSEASPRTQTLRIVEQLAEEEQQLEDEVGELEQQIQSHTEMLNSGALISASTLKTHLEVAKDRTEQLDRDVERLIEQETRSLAQQQELQRRQQDRAHEKNEIQDLRRQIEQASQQLSAMQSSNRVFYNATSGSGRTPWLVEIGQQEILAARQGATEPPMKFQSSSQFLMWAGRQSASGIQFVLLLKPDAVDEYWRISKGLDKGGFVTGFDALRIEQTAIDPIKGSSQ